MDDPSPPDLNRIRIESNTSNKTSIGDLSKNAFLIDDSKNLDNKGFSLNGYSIKHDSFHNYQIGSVPIDDLSNFVLNNSSPKEIPSQISNGQINIIFSSSAKSPDPNSAINTIENNNNSGLGRKKAHKKGKSSKNGNKNKIYADILSNDESGNPNFLQKDQNSSSLSKPLLELKAVKQEAINTSLNLINNSSDDNFYSIDNNIADNQKNSLDAYPPQTYMNAPYPIPQNYDKIAIDYKNNNNYNTQNYTSSTSIPPNYNFSSINTQPILNQTKSNYLNYYDQNYIGSSANTQSFSSEKVNPAKIDTFNMQYQSQPAAKGQQFPSQMQQAPSSQYSAATRSGQSDAQAGFQGGQQAANTGQVQNAQQAGQAAQSHQSSPLSDAAQKQQRQATDGQTQQGRVAKAQPVPIFQQTSARVGQHQQIHAPAIQQASSLPPAQLQTPQGSGQGGKFQAQQQQTQTQTQNQQARGAQYAKADAAYAQTFPQSRAQYAQDAAPHTMQSYQTPPPPSQPFQIQPPQSRSSYAYQDPSQTQPPYAAPPYQRPHSQAPFSIQPPSHPQPSEEATSYLSHAFQSQLSIQNKIHQSIESQVRSLIVTEPPLFSYAMLSKDLVINPYKLKFEPFSYWDECREDFTFERIVNTFFRSEKSRISKFIYKLYDMLLITSKIPMFKGIVGVCWVTDRIFSVNVQSIAAMLNVVSSSVYFILFGKKQAFESHGFLEITPENFHEAGLSMFPEISEPEIKLMFHRELRFVNKELSTSELDEIDDFHLLNLKSRNNNVNVPMKAKYPGYLS